jgi:hypothetical protein
VCAVAAKKSDVSAIDSVLPQHEHIHTDWQAWSKVLDEPAVPEQQPLRSGDSSSDAEDAADGAVTTDSIDSESQNTQERVEDWVQWKKGRAQEEQQAGHSGRAYERQLQERMAHDADAAKTKRLESPSFDDSDSQSQSQEESQPLF